MLNKEAYLNKYLDIMLEEGYNCAQSIMLGIMYFVKDIDEKKEMEYLHLAGSLGGGVAGMGQTCGFITGAVLGYSLIYDDNDVIKEKVKKINDLVIEYGSSWECEKIIASYNDHPDNRRKSCSKILEKLLAYLYDELNIYN